MQYNITERIRGSKVQVIISYKTDRWRQKAKSFNKEEVLKKNDWINSTVKLLDIPVNTLENLCNEFLERIKLYREYKTYVNYLTVVNHMKDILPLEVTTINSKHIQKLVDSLYLKGFKTSTIGCYVTRIRSIFEYYRKTYNKDYTNPTLSLLMHKKERKEFTLIEDIQNILVWTKNNFTYEEYLIVKVALSTGLRKSEIFGLSIEDIKQGQIKVHQQLKRSEYGLVYGSLKTSNSYRIVPISTQLEEELKAFKEKGIIFTINPYTFSNGYCRKLKKEYGITFHHFRHFYCSKLIELGIDYTTVSKLAGHTTKQLMDTYSHMTDNMYNKAKDLILSDKIISY